MFLFKEDDLIRSVRTGAERPGIGYLPEEEYDACEFLVQARDLQDRLELLGIGRHAVEDVFRELIAQQLSSTGRYAQLDSLKDHYLREMAALDGLTYDRWIAEFRQASAKAELSPRARREPGSLGWLLALWDDVDPRLVLRAVVDAFPTDTVVMDVTALEDGGWIEPGTAPRDAAIANFAWAMENGAPAIVIAEGKTDIHVLSSAFPLLRPHLDGFLKFADFSFGNEGGASALVRTVKTFAASGITNRVVAIFDNDTAASDAKKVLNSIHLPKNIIVMQYPAIALAEDYPTLGPTGPAKMDVNGVAASIELYLGADVLADSNGELRPIQWTGYVKGIGRYQGEIVDKVAILARFESKLRLAREDPGQIRGQDWSALGSVFDAIQARLAV
jgi:hypothetical protein